MRKQPKAKPPDNAEQSARFISTAREREVDEKGDAFERAMKAVVPAKPGTQSNSKRPPKG
jgi:hypothetical protein